MSLREAGKQKRREIILATAEELIRRDGNVSFSMRTLAEEAGVAFVTPFNLFGNKAGILGALLHTRLESQRIKMAEQKPDSDPIQKLFDLAHYAGHAFTDDPALIRPLLRSVREVERLDHMLLYRTAIETWTLILQEATAAGLILPNWNVDFLARSLHITLRGVISLWRLREIETAEFERQVEYGVATTLLGAASDQARPNILQRIEAIEQTKTVYKKGTVATP